MQLFGQRFMRQVPYQRPKGFMDNYAPKTVNPTLSKEYTLLKRRQMANASAHQLNRCKPENFSTREMKNLILEEEFRDIERDSFANDARNVGYAIEFSSGNNIGGHLSEMESCHFTQSPSQEQVGAIENIQEGIDFGNIVRTMTIGENTSESDGISITAFEAKAVISCWLIIKEHDLGSLVISTRLTEGKRAETVAEAEIGLNQLFEVKGVVMDALEGDPSVLSSICREILETVELRIEDGHPRLVLSLSPSKFKLANDGSNSEETSLEDALSQESNFVENRINADTLHGTFVLFKIYYYLLVLFFT